MDFSTAFFILDSKYFDAPFSDKTSYVYDYDFLIHQPDMKVVMLPGLSELKNDIQIDRQRIGLDGMKNASEHGRQSDNTIIVTNNYTKNLLTIGENAIRHGLGGENIPRLRTNSKLGARIGELVKNAIPINRLESNNRQAAGAYAMVSSAFDSNGREYVAVITVNQMNTVNDVKFVDVVHSVSGRNRRRDSGEHGKKTLPQWKALSTEKRKAITETVRQHSKTFSEEAKDLLNIGFNDSISDMAEAIYNDYALSPVAAEYKWKNFVGHIDDLISSFSKITEGNKVRYAIDEGGYMDALVGDYQQRQDRRSPQLLKNPPAYLKARFGNNKKQETH